MVSRLQALQDILIKGLIPLADLTGKVSESLDSGTAMPTKEALWEGLSNSLLLLAAANQNSFQHFSRHIKVAMNPMFRIF